MIHIGIWYVCNFLAYLSQWVSWLLNCLFTHLTPLRGILVLLGHEPNTVNIWTLDRYLFGSVATRRILITFSESNQPYPKWQEK